jgi:hypothetical protein
VVAGSIKPKWKKRRNQWLLQLRRKLRERNRQHKRRRIMKMRSPSVAVSSSSRHTESREQPLLTRLPKKVRLSMRKIQRKPPRKPLDAARADLASLRWYTDAKMRWLRKQRGKKRRKRVRKEATRRRRVAKVIRTNKKGARRMAIIEGRGRLRIMKSPRSLTVLTKNSVLATGATRNVTRS